MRRGEVHRVADDRVLAPLLRADVADDGLAGVHADADPQRRLALRRRAAALKPASACCISSAQATARPAWSGWSSGAPKYASMPSPMNLSSVPPWRNTTSDHQGEVLVQELDHLLGSSIRAAMAVKPRMSEKSTVTSRDWLVWAARPARRICCTTAGEK